MNCFRTFFKSPSGERGAALIEAAATIAPTLVLILGALELAVMFVQYQAVEAAAVEASNATIIADLDHLTASENPGEIRDYYRQNVSEGIFYSRHFDYELRCFKSLEAAANGAPVLLPCPSQWRFAEVTAKLDYSAMTPLISAIIGERTIVAKALVTQ